VGSNETVLAIADGLLICSAAMLRWSSSSLADTRQQPSDGDGYSEMAQIRWQTSARISIALGIGWLAVRLRGGPLGITGEVISLLLLTAGIVMTAYHALPAQE
jgi:hypothetical protein